MRKRHFWRARPSGDDDIAACAAACAAAVAAVGPTDVGGAAPGQRPDAREDFPLPQTEGEDGGVRADTTDRGESIPLLSLPADVAGAAREEEVVAAAEAARRQAAEEFADALLRMREEFEMEAEETAARQARVAEEQEDALREIREVHDDAVQLMREEHAAELSSLRDESEERVSRREAELIEEYSATAEDMKRGLSDHLVTLQEEVSKLVKRHAQEIGEHAEAAVSSKVEYEARLESIEGEAVGARRREARTVGEYGERARVMEREHAEKVSGLREEIKAANVAAERLRRQVQTEEAARCPGGASRGAQAEMRDRAVRELINSVKISRNGTEEAMQVTADAFVIQVDRRTSNNSNNSNTTTTERTNSRTSDVGVGSGGDPYDGPPSTGIYLDLSEISSMNEQGTGGARMHPPDSDADCGGVDGFTNEKKALGSIVSGLSNTACTVS